MSDHLEPTQPSGYWCAELTTMKPVFEYLDYRALIADMYAELKQAYAFYSYRLFSRKAGFASPNFVQMVIGGKRNLTKESVFKFIKVLGLDKKEADYFENLVFFNQSSSLEQKNSYLKALLKHRNKTDPALIESSTLEYYKEWYHPVIRELSTANDFFGDFKKLGSMLIPSISAAQARRSVELLESLGFIKKQPDGGFEKTSVSLQTGPIVRSVAVANYHKSTMKLAAEAIERFPASQRDISSLTLAISTETKKTMIEKVRLFRQELLALAELDSVTNEVVQVNFQLFPLSINTDSEVRQ